MFFLPHSFFKTVQACKLCGRLFINQMSPASHESLQGIITMVNNHSKRATLFGTGSIPENARRKDLLLSISHRTSLFQEQEAQPE
jgi:hypothetical protein